MKSKISSLFFLAVVFLAAFAFTPSQAAAQHRGSFYSAPRGGGYHGGTPSVPRGFAPQGFGGNRSGSMMPRSGAMPVMPRLGTTPGGFSGNRSSGFHVTPTMPRSTMPLPTAPQSFRNRGGFSGDHRPNWGGGFRGGYGQRRSFYRPHPWELGLGLYVGRPMWGGAYYGYYGVPSIFDGIQYQGFYYGYEYWNGSLWVPFGVNAIQQVIGDIIASRVANAEFRQRQQEACTQMAIQAAGRLSGSADNSTVIDNSMCGKIRATRYVGNPADQQGDNGQASDGNQGDNPGNAAVANQAANPSPQQPQATQNVTEQRIEQILHEAVDKMRRGGAKSATVHMELYDGQPLDAILFSGNATGDLHQLAQQLARGDVRAAYAIIETADGQELNVSIFAANAANDQPITGNQ